MGVISAVIGALVDYRLARGREEGETRGLPGCMFLVTGFLGLAGLVALGLSLLLAGGLARPLVAGIGVVTGFLAGFVAMLGLWMILDKRGCLS